jgi:hypothetical protein
LTEKKSSTTFDFDICLFIQEKKLQKKKKFNGLENDLQTAISLEFTTSYFFLGGCFNVF